jgi:hypothetical protein
MLASFPLLGSVVNCPASGVPHGILFVRADATHLLIVDPTVNRGA